ncbi:MAG: TRAP transporter substrate-binding protein [Candidatus Puniceispirillum sp.]
MNNITTTVASALSAALIAARASAASITLTVASWAGPKHVMNASFFPYYKDAIEKCSGGDLTLKVEFGLAPPPALYDTVRDGVADMTWVVHGYTPGKFLTTKLAELPGVPGNSQSISVAYQKTWEKYLEAAGEAKGVQTLSVFVHGPGMVHTIPEVRSFKDLEGMKLRVGGGVANDIGTALGVAGVNVPAPAVYETLASGVAEGVFFPMETMYAFKVAEHAKHSYVNPDGMYTTSFGLLLNQDTYDSLSDKQRGCIDGNRGPELTKVIGGMWDEADAIGLREAKKMGLKIIEWSQKERDYFKAKTASIEAKVLGEISSRGVDAKAALDYFKSQL